MKNKVLKAITSVAAVSWVVSACAIDSESPVPFIANMISIAWIGLFTYANQEMY